MNIVEKAAWGSEFKKKNPQYDWMVDGVRKLFAVRPRPDFFEMSAHDMFGNDITEFKEAPVKFKRGGIHPTIEIIETKTTIKLNDTNIVEL